MKLLLLLLDLDHALLPRLGLLLWQRIVSELARVRRYHDVVPELLRVRHLSLILFLSFLGSLFVSNDSIFNLRRQFEPVSQVQSGLVVITAPEMTFILTADILQVTIDPSLGLLCKAAPFNRNVSTHRLK